MNLKSLRGSDLSQSAGLNYFLLFFKDLILSITLIVRPTVDWFNIQKTKINFMLLFIAAEK